MSTLYQGRFEGSAHEAIRRLNDSLPFDRRLWREDIAGSIAHATMLGEQGIVPVEDATAMVAGLEAIRASLAEGALALPMDAEDIHTAVEQLLKARIGEVAGKLHTARSRNDQVATDLRLYVREAIDAVQERVGELQRLLVQLAEREIDMIMPGYTHLQHAQPVRLSLHLLAWNAMLQRDRERLGETRARMNRLPLGAGALAGTGFPIDRERVAELLGFEGLCTNSLDAVADRDFVVELLSDLALLGIHLSRIGEELVLWNSREFGFITLSDGVATGSSMMPQKKNPDIAELARGKAGRLVGHLTASLVMLKGLPLAYNKDLQEDKEGLFDAVDTMLLLLPALTAMLDGTTFDRGRMAAACAGDFSTATDLADTLVRAGVPFREAHGVVAQLVRRCLDEGRTLEQLSGEDLTHVHPALSELRFDPVAAVESRSSVGGPSRESVLAQLASARAALMRA